MAIFDPVKSNANWWQNPNRVQRMDQYGRDLNAAPSMAEIMARNSGMPFGGAPAAPAPGTPAPGAAPSGQSAADKMYDPIKRLTEGRADELRNDPVQTEVMNYLRGIVSGQQQPYNDTMLNALKSQYGKGAASAEAAQMQQLQQALGAGGGSIYDPSYQAASRELQSQRQGQNLDYAGQLDSQANLANFQARQNAATQMGGFNQAQNAMINQLGLAGAGYQAQRFQEVPSGTAPQAGMPQTNGVLMPQYNPAMQQQAAKPAAQPAAPQPAAATTMAKAPSPFAAAPQPQAQPQQPQRTGQSQGQQSFGSPDAVVTLLNALKGTNRAF